MSQIEIDRVLSQIRALSAQVRPAGPAASAPLGAGGAVPQATGEAAFANVLRRSLDQVSATQARASALATSFERGAPGVELPQVMLEMQKASVSFRAVVEVRNRLVEAYREIMNMPI
jgi:flagellar hook-basal body complex protein FliE